MPVCLQEHVRILLREPPAGRWEAQRSQLTLILHDITNFWAEIEHVLKAFHDWETDSTKYQKVSKQKIRRLTFQLDLWNFVSNELKQISSPAMKKLTYKSMHQFLMPTSKPW